MDLLQCTQDLDGHDLVLSRVHLAKRLIQSTNKIARYNKELNEM